MSAGTFFYVLQCVATLALMTMLDQFIRIEGAPLVQIFPLGRLVFIAFAILGLGFSTGALYSTFRDIQGIRIAKFNGPSHSLASGRRMAATYRLFALLYLYSLSLLTGVTVSVPTVLTTRLVWFHVAVAVLLAFNAIADLVTSVAVQRAVNKEMKL